MMSQQSKVLQEPNRARKDDVSEATVSHQTVLAGLKSRNFHRLYILGVLLFYCALFYYFGELVNFFGWEALRWSIFYGVHDIHRLFFLAPILYSAYVFGVRATIIITIISAMTFIPRAFFISPFPDPVLRMTIFTVIAGVMGYLVATVRRESERRTHLEILLTSERDKIFGILERMGDGVLVTGPDYKVRFVNPSMVRDFGEGIGSHCYEYLHNLDQPCEDCKLPKVIGGEIVRWEYTFPDGRIYELLTSPYTDSDGTVCQLATFRNITQRKKD